MQSTSVGEGQPVDGHCPGVTVAISLSSVSLSGKYLLNVDKDQARSMFRKKISTLFVAGSKSGYVKKFSQTFPLSKPRSTLGIPVGRPKPQVFSPPPRFDTGMTLRRSVVHGSTSPKGE